MIRIRKKMTMIIRTRTINKIWEMRRNYKPPIKRQREIPRKKLNQNYRKKKKRNQTSKIHPINKKLTVKKMLPSKPPLNKLQTRLPIKIQLRVL